MQIVNLGSGDIVEWIRIEGASLDVLSNPVPQALPVGASFYEIGIAIAWLAALGMYLGLGYMIFINRWNSARSAMD